MSALPGLAWFCAGFGFCLGVVICLVVVVDLVWASTNQLTISQRALAAAYAQPWVVALFCAPVCLVVGILIGHLFFPQSAP